MSPTFRIIEHTIRSSHTRERLAGAEPGKHNSLHLHVKQYIPLSNSSPREGDVTILGAVANAYPKEIHEPLWQSLYHHLLQRGKRIRGIWIADPVNTGLSGVLNEGLLGPDPSWFDHGRDLLFLVNQFQEEIVQPIFGIGHSMGAAHLGFLAHIHPRLMCGLVLMDPVIQKEGGGSNWAAASTFRRDLWGSREEASAALRKSKGLQSWDRRVLEKYIEFGLRDLPTETYPSLPTDGTMPVTLTTPKEQEVLNYQRPNYEDERMLHFSREDLDRDFPPGEAPNEEKEPFSRLEKNVLHEQLPSLRPATLYIFGENSEVSKPEGIRDKLEITGTGRGGSGGRAKGRVQGVVLDCGHLVPLERPDEAGEACAEFVGREVERWVREEAVRRERWGRLTRKERVGINDLWKDKVGGPPGGRKATANSGERANRTKL